MKVTVAVNMNAPALCAGQTVCIGEIFVKTHLKGTYNDIIDLMT